MNGHFKAPHRLFRRLQDRPPGGKKALTLSLANFTNTVNPYAAIRDSSDCQPLHGEG